MRYYEGTLQIGYDYFKVKTKSVLKLFVGSLGNLRFDKKSFFHTLFCYPPYWDHKSSNVKYANSLGAYTSEKNLYLCTIYKTRLKCDVKDGSVVYGLKQPTLYSFALNKPPGYKQFCESKTKH